MPNALHVFTCAAVNYLPKVRILCRSLRQHHPEAVIHVALADERPAWLDLAGEPFDSVLEIGDLGIPDWRRWTFQHSIVELATAIKPFALRRLLDLPDCRTVLYFDPDIVLFSRVDDIVAMLATANLALTPHQTTPEQNLEAILDNEVASLKHGIFNLGFIGVSNTDEGRRFATWWSERTRLLCRAEVANGLFTDQKWINFAPVFFDGVAIVKSPRHNVATWNLTTRRMTGDFESGLAVDGLPLGFYHFTGFDSGAHAIMAIKNAATSPAVANLITWYAHEIDVAEHDPVSQWPWAFGRYSDGTPILPAHRWLYREHRDLQEVFPDPYDARADRPTFLDWCETEGRLRFPEVFAGNPPAKPPSLQPRVSAATMMRLSLLMLAPRGGRSLRDRVYRMYRREGWRGFARRLPRAR